METAVTKDLNKKKTRVIVKNGSCHFALCVCDIVLFESHERTIFVTDKFSNRYSLNKSLSEIQEDLDEKMFFRANRQQIINVNYIRCFRVFEKVKLSVELSIIQPNNPVIISQETAPLFKKWLCES
jgi:DNA-binding LytR/AlgR family response regulator